MRHYRNSCHAPIPALSLRMGWLSLIALLVMAVGGAMWAFEGGKTTIQSPVFIAGENGNGDERDVDIYPAIAYDDVTGRYLAVWQSVRNAGSASDGMDVYGIFLDSKGRPSSDAFRISDDNDAARGSPPKVAAGSGEFAVVWTRHSNYCQVVVQRVTDATNPPDQVLVSSLVHSHSPVITYDPLGNRYAIAYVSGNDFMPPKLFGSNSADCGNDAASKSGIGALSFQFTHQTVTILAQSEVSDQAQGTFRPALAFDAESGRYAVLWEDRRNAGSSAPRLDVYARQLNRSLTPLGEEQALSVGDVYDNDDDSATWTPRPVAAASDGGFLAAWWGQTDDANGKTRFVWGRFASEDTWEDSNVLLSRATFAQSHAGSAPTGFLSLVYVAPTQEYLLGVTSHLESLWGYFSSARVQRVTPDGRLLKLDGSISSSPGVGYAIDYANDDQLSLGLAVNPVLSDGKVTILVLYGKHAPHQHSQDFDIWGVQMQMEADASEQPLHLWLPMLRYNRATGVERRI